MKLLVAYDITDDARRERLAGILLDYGQRVQGSLFWLDVEEELVDRMRRRVMATMDAGTDSVWMVFVCEACARKLEAYGVQPVPVLPGFFII